MFILSFVDLESLHQIKTTLMRAQSSKDLWEAGGPEVSRAALLSPLEKQRYKVRNLFGALIDINRDIVLRAEFQ